MAGITFISAVLLMSGPAGAATPLPYSWGHADLSTAPVVRPTLVNGLPSNITAFCEGFAGQPQVFHLALDSLGNVYSWGGNRHGVLGNGTNVANDTPTVVAGVPGISQIACGGDWSAVVDTTGGLWTWGQGDKGEMGDGTFNSYLVPHQVPGVTNAASVAAGGGSGVASLTDGSVITWGRNTDGELGIGTQTMDSNVPVAVPGLTGITAVSHSWQTAGAIDSSGNVWVWGFTGFGERGDGTLQSVTPSPFQVPLPRPALQQSVGGNAGTNGHVLALLNDGTVWAWGADGYGQVGNGAFVPAVLTPTKVPILAAVREIGAGGVFSVAVTTKGKVLTWGNNGFGQLGDGTTVSRATPERLSTPSTPVSVLGFGEGGIDALF